MSSNHHHHGSAVFNKVVKAKQKVASVLMKNAKTIELTFDQRQELPHECVASDGTVVFCHIHDPVEVGDRLISENNEWALISAATEELFEISRRQAGFEQFLHVAGLSMWPLQLTEQGARVVASHDCIHMLEHFGLTAEVIQAPIEEIVVPELEHHAGCGHDHDHDHDHGHSHDHDH